MVDDGFVVDGLAALAVAGYALRHARSGGVVLELIFLAQDLQFQMINAVMGSELQMRNVSMGLQCQITSYNRL